MRGAHQVPAARGERVERLVVSADSVAAAVPRARLLRDTAVTAACVDAAVAHVIAPAREQAERAWREQKA